MLIENVKNCILEVLGETKLKSLDHVYEQKGNQLKLIISIHNLNLIHDILIHTKLIFNVNEDKTEIEGNTLSYLYDLNCKYRLMKFDDEDSLKEILIDIFFDFKFGEDIKNLSTFLKSPARMVNEYLHLSDFKDNSVLTIDYQPRFNITKCSDYIMFFKVNMINDYEFDFNIKKEELNYIFNMSYNSETVEEETNTLKNSIPAIIGEYIKDLIF